MKIVVRFVAFCSVIVLSGLLVAVPKAHADTLGVMQGYQVPGGANPYSVVEGANGNLWFTQQSSAKKVWKFDRNNYDPGNPSAAFTSYTLTQMPSHIANGPDNTVWIVAGGKVVRITSGGTITEFNMPAVWVSGGWRTYNAYSVTMGPDNLLWVSTMNSHKPDAVIRMYPTGVVAGMYEGIPEDPGQEIIESTTDYANQRVWVITRSWTSAGGYVSKATYFNQDGTHSTYTLGIASVMTGTMGSNGSFWAGGDGKKFQNIDSAGTLSSVYTLSQNVSGLWRIRAGGDGFIWGTLSGSDKLVRISEDGNMANAYVTGLVPGGNGGASARPIGLAPGSDGNMWFVQYSNNRISKVGTGTDGTGVDTDGDGLNRAQEIQLGTSDFADDTDSDGLSDDKESSWYANRDELFCGTSCAYPNPLKRDIYIEADWMVKPGEDGYAMQLSSAQIDAVQTAFANKGINIYFDTGQYGGGNEVPYTSIIEFRPEGGAVDFHDYKEGGDGISAQFDSDRLGVYHYMLSGHSYYDDEGDTGSTGAAYPGDDDLFIAYGLMKEGVQSGLLDMYVAGTTIHELGHNLCLTNPTHTEPDGIPAYDGQPAACRFTGIDAAVGGNYPSAMNYNKQFELVDYSMGLNATGDHNDWAVIRVHDFANSTAGDDAHGFSAKKNNKIKVRPIDGPKLKVLLRS